LDLHFSETKNNQAVFSQSNSATYSKGFAVKFVIILLSETTFMFTWKRPSRESDSERQDSV